MALYDSYINPEELLRPERQQAALRPAAVDPYGVQAVAPGAGQLAPNFIGGDVDATTGNFVPGTRQGVERGRKVTPYGVLPGVPGVPTATPPLPTPPPTLPASRLASI